MHDQLSSLPFGSLFLQNNPALLIYVSRYQPPRPADFQTALLSLPSVEVRIADLLLAIHVGRLCAALLLVHDRDDLLVLAPAPLHLSAP